MGDRTTHIGVNLECQFFQLLVIERGQNMAMNFSTWRLFFGFTMAAVIVQIGTPSYANESRLIEASKSSEMTAQATTPATIVEIAASNPSFTTLVQAVQAAGLVETLSGEGPFTVFAPTNEAFAALPAGTLETLLLPENQALLQRVLTYHVVAGEVTSSDIQPGQVITVEGNPVTLDVMGGNVMVNQATVVAADVQASNGVIHVIDRVILPPGL